MHGSERREQIIRQIQESKAPVSGTKLASFYNVSRQVISAGYCTDPGSRI